jgi:RNA recognition motif-containing protein
MQMKGKRTEPAPSNVLFISNIPPSSNTVPILLRHFKQFGHVNSVSCSGTTATVIFETEGFAQAAVESPIPLAHNRFIHIGFHRSPASSFADLESICDLALVRSETQQALDAIAVEKADTVLLNDRLKVDRLYKLHQHDSETYVRQVTSTLNSMLSEADGLIAQYERSTGARKLEVKDRLDALSRLIEEARTQMTLFKADDEAP